VQARKLGGVDVVATFGLRLEDKLDLTLFCHLTRIPLS